MSLARKPTLTEKTIAANQLNGALSQGPATVEGMEQSRSARASCPLWR